MASTDSFMKYASPARLNFLCQTVFVSRLRKIFTGSPNWHPGQTSSLGSFSAGANNTALSPHLQQNISHHPPAEAKRISTLVLGKKGKGRLWAETLLQTCWSHLCCFLSFPSCSVLWPLSLSNKGPRAYPRNTRHVCAAHRFPTSAPQATRACF